MYEVLNWLRKDVDIEMLNEITIYNFAKACNAADDDKFDVETMIKDFDRFKKLAFRYPDDYRTAKSDYMHNLGIDKMGSEEYKKCYKAIEEISNYYGRRSFTFNTLVRSISQVKKTKEQVTREVKRRDSLPPAFDKYLRATRSNNRELLRRELENWIINGKDDFLWDMKKRFEDVLEDLKKSSKQIITLDNGTTTTIEWNGININDILSIAFAPECVMDSNISKLGLRLKVANRYSVDDGFVYIPLGSSEIYRECGGDHIEIPDKDAKIREIYRMYPWVQVVSKKLHQLLDRVARKLEGNYTYKHRDWLKNLVSQEWNRTKYIIGADMTKYSDTLDRSFIVYILKCMGFNDRLCELIDYVYGMSIYDPTKIVILKDSDATFQGQYGDFPMITIANLILQRFIYKKVNQRCKLGYNAAVGDDTGMIFDKYDSNIMDTVIEVYGCVGVNINRDKTGELIMGKGSIDFVKLEVDQYGIMEFLNTRSLNEQNIDSLVRDVLDLMTISDNKRWTIAEHLFGVGSGIRLADLSIINGGINNRPIEERDIALYVSRSEKLKRLQTVSVDEVEFALNKMQDFLKNDMEDGWSYNLCDTPLAAYLDKYDGDLNLEDRDGLDEIIKLVILNMQRLGLNRGTLKNFSNWMGVKPLDARTEFDNRELGRSCDDELADIWEEISSYETFAARRKQSEAKKDKRISYMLPVIRGLYDRIDVITIQENEFYEETIIKSVEQYRRSELKYKAMQNVKIALRKLEGVAFLSSEYYFGYLYRYLYIKTETGTAKRRVYDVDYRSNYTKISREEFDTYLWPYLKDINMKYEDFVINFRESAYGSLVDSKTLSKMGIIC